ncbi:hypothetical protein KKH3_18570 [Pectobacterium actinidiae]|nr:hypothetical protein KKH3_18570 [Pectobacterium actinidiae]
MPAYVILHADGVSGHCYKMKKALQEAQKQHGKCSKQHSN